MKRRAIDNPFEIGGWKELCYSKRTLAYYHGREAMAHLAVGSTDSDNDLHFDIIFELNPEFEVWLIENERCALLVEDHTVGLAFRKGKTKKPCYNTGYIVISKPRIGRLLYGKEPEEI